LALFVVMLAGALFQGRLLYKTIQAALTMNQLPPAVAG